MQGFGAPRGLPRPYGGVLGVGAAVVAASVYAHKDRLQDFRPRLPPAVIEATAGAVGEVAQIAVLYPLDTIKVRCQAAGLGAREVVSDLTRGGLNTGLLRQLYAGALGAVLSSIFVGAVHFWSFCATRRALLESQLFGGGASRPGAVQAQAAHEQRREAAGSSQLRVSHGATGTHFSSAHELAHERGEHGDGSASSNGGSASSSGGSGGAGAVGGGSGEERRLGANVVAALTAAVLTAVVEAPMELFRHNAQAGHLQGSFLDAMLRTLRTRGPGALYYGFVPHCLESWPYDVSELLCVAALRDTQADMLRLPSPVAAALSSLPQQAYDLGVGAVAGTVAVLVSHPFDSVKTYMQTHPTGGGRMGAGVSEFARVAAQMVRGGGPRALFVGLTPRLVHQVPGACVCWWAIESCHRFLSRAAAAGTDAAGENAGAAATL